MTISMDFIHDLMRSDYPLSDDTVCLTLPETDIVIRSNSEALLSTLRHYFRHIVCSSEQASDTAIQVVAIESPVIKLDVDWKEWSREAGKSGRKDAYIDLDGARCIYKVRTGMLFLQSMTHRIAAGPCLANSNQIINFVNNQYMNLLQQQGWLICHAAALAHDNRAIAIAGFSGGGKSTSMLHLMNDPQFDYLTNDRLFIKKTGASTQARGIPKLPRVNPGTLLHNPMLKPIMPKDQLSRLQSMPQQELWNLEEKYDVDIVEIYGQERFAAAPELAHFFILNWSHNSPEPAHIREIIPNERAELLDAIMKSCGPFYQKADGSFYNDHTPLQRQAYIAMLRGVQVYEVSGRVDFPAIRQFIATHCAVSPATTHPA